MSYRIQEIKFAFTLTTNYYKRVIEDYSVIGALYNVKVILNNDLATSFAKVNIELDPQLRRYCKNVIRLSTLLDIFVILLLIINILVYLRSIVNTMRLSKVMTIIKLVILSLFAGNEIKPLKYFGICYMRTKGLCASYFL